MLLTNAKETFESLVENTYIANIISYGFGHIILLVVHSSLAPPAPGVPKRPGTPEIPQTYNNTALVLWKPADTKAPCSYTLERKTEGVEHYFVLFYMTAFRQNFKTYSTLRL